MSKDIEAEVTHSFLCRLPSSMAQEWGGPSHRGIVWIALAQALLYVMTKVLTEVRELRAEMKANVSRPVITRKND